MNDVSVYLKENLPSSVSRDRLYMAPEIPEKKLNNAVIACKYQGKPSSVIAFIDITAFGSAKDGILLTGECIIYKPTFESPILAKFIDIEGFYQEEKDLVVKLKDNSEFKILSASEADFNKLSEILNHILNSEVEYKDTDQMLTVSAMSEALKFSYLQFIVNLTYSDDGVVDEKEFAEIFMLMTRLDLSNETRFKIREYISEASNSQMVSAEKLIEVIGFECPQGQLKAVHISLFKDLISVHMSTSEESISSCQYLNENRKLFNVSDEEVELAVMAIDNDRKMLSGDYNDDMIKRSLKALSAKATAVGVPLGAVYLSGSVVGMSAAGLTSGLASLGFGGALGLSSMATGIGVAVLLGVGAYKGMQHLTGSNELDKSKRRSLMLTEVIKQTQKTISTLMSDINYIVEKLNFAIGSTEDQSMKIKKLALMLDHYVKAGKVLSERSDALEKGRTKTKCPRYLDVDKLKTLTTEPTKQDAREYVLSRYQEKTVKIQKNEGEPESESLEWVMNDNLDITEMDNLAGTFDAIGYFNMASVVGGSASKIAGDAKSKFKGLFS
ncbi:MAG: hypothetical protein ABNH16_13860 [Thalassolituus sp.]|jgi:hypothetical protein